jgi:NAD(P)-dependent dehydrogenase (short-subunit alcohol dehydrogenase family)
LPWRNPYQELEFMKTVLITGAAHGIGLATARHFAGKGWFVGLYDINSDALDGLLASGTFPQACGSYCDVTRRDSIEEALDHFARHTNGRLDVLVNNAAGHTGEPVLSIQRARPATAGGLQCVKILR